MEELRRFWCAAAKLPRLSAHGSGPIFAARLFVNANIMPLNIFRSIRAGENFHVVLWLIKDVSWIIGWKTLGVTMFFPTLAIAIWIAWKSREETGELLHCLAVVSWIMANGIWMIGEFWFDDTSRQVAIPFFIVGRLCVGWYYLVMLPSQAHRRAKG